MNVLTPRFLCVLVALAAFSWSAESSAQNIILNPGFEAGTAGDADGWEEFGGPAGTTARDSSMPNSGGFSMLMMADHINNTPSAVPYFVQQVQPVGSIDNTLNYDLSFSAKVDTLDFEGIDLFYQIQWLDQDASDGGGVIGESLVPLITEGIDTSYQSFGMTDIDVPNGADSFLLRFQISPGPIPGIANGLFVDDVSLSVNGVVPGVPGDTDGDGDVDLVDLDTLGANFGAGPGAVGGASIGDFDGDGDVDLVDLDTLGANFGTGTAAAVPEPSALLLAALAIAGARLSPRRGA